jgi:ribosomal protein S18 acetylase RimI-like enzyme
VTLRAPTLGDVPRLGRFFSLLHETYGTDGESENEVRDWLTNPVFDPEADFRLGLAGEDVVAWCDVWDQNRQHRRFFTDVRAHPRSPEVYELLLGWAEARVRPAAVAGAVLRSAADSRNDVLAEELTRRGFRPIRHFFRMHADLGEEPLAPRWPAGISVRTFRDGDARAVYDANLDAFADHWDFEPIDFEDWQHLLIRASDFDPALWFIAEEGNEIAGICLCALERRPGTGHVHILGVRPHWRRRGLGTTLLLHAFRELRRRGRAQADLGVDGENTTGAVRLYERAGMRVATRVDAFELALT